MNSVQIFTDIQAVDLVSPAAQAALAICDMRYQSPFDQVPCMYGSLERWRAIIFEAALMKLLAAPF